LEVRYGFNALRYTPPSGWIRVEIEPRFKETLFRIIDSGYGIPPEDLPFVFDGFTRWRKPGPLRKGEPVWA